jgi:methionyl-tRNA formyltransferase
VTAERAAAGVTPSGAGLVPRARTVFFGSGAFGRPILDALVEAPEAEVVAVVSAPDRPVGRRHELTPVPVAERARDLGVPLVQPQRLRHPEAVADVESLGATLGVLADYGQIVPSSVLGLFPDGILNVHPSLLPRHRGAAPLPAAILAGDTETGVTLIRMDTGLDTGPIAAVDRWPLRGDETAPELERAAATAGAALVARTLGPWLRGEIATEPQDERHATLTRPLRRDDGRLDAARPAHLLARQVRAYAPWPGTFVETDAGRLIVHRASVAGGDQRPVGTFGEGPELRIATADGWLVLEEVQPAGGRRMSGRALLVGRPGLAGSTVR